MSGDDRSWNDGDKLSFSERDRRRREGRSSPGEQRSKGISKTKEEAVTKQYIKQLDGLFSKTKGGVEVEKLGAAVRAPVRDRVPYRLLGHSFPAVVTSPLPGFASRGGRAYPSGEHSWGGERCDTF